MSNITLPWPPQELSGHHNVHWRVLQPIKKKHRAWASAATQATQTIAVPATGDIRVIVTFYPPDRRSDRVNFANRMKPYFDGIADALKVNDRRFLPTYIFAEPVESGRVSVEIVENEARAIGDILSPIIADIASRALAQLLPHCASATDRKELIMSARLHGAISDEAAELLIQANQLETA